MPSQRDFLGSIVSRKSKASKRVVKGGLGHGLAAAGLGLRVTQTLRCRRRWFLYIFDPFLIVFLYIKCHACPCIDENVLQACILLVSSTWSENWNDILWLLGLEYSRVRNKHSRTLINFLTFFQGLCLFKGLRLFQTLEYTCSCPTKIHGGTPFNVLSGANNEYLDIHGYWHLQ